MKPAIDILFVTSLTMPRDSGSGDIYDPLRLKLEGKAATVDQLAALCAGDAVPALGPLGVSPTRFAGPLVLTPYYLKDYMARRGLSLFDVPCFETHVDAVAELLRRGVGLVAISTTWIASAEGANEVREAAKKLRQLAPDTPIVAGGVGVRKGLRCLSLMERKALPPTAGYDLSDQYLLLNAARDSDIDAVVTSEGGEETLARIALKIRNGEDFRSLPNLALPAGDHYHFTEQVHETTDLEREFVDWRNHSNRLQGVEAAVRTATGCPYSCGFCDFAKLYQPRLRSLESLIAELKTLADALPAPRPVFFADDNVAINRKRLLGLVRALIDENLQLTWRGFIRADSIDEEVAALMKESGCRECLLGIESGDGGVLKNMNKHLDPEKALRAVEILDKNGINTQCTFVVGFPGESARSVESTAALISSFPSGPGAGALHRYYLFRFNVLPLCPAASAEQREKFQLRGIGEHWSHYSMNSEEAASAIRDLFLKVQGPTHMYLELLPPKWPLAQTRAILEKRDAIQKNRLLGKERPEEVDELLNLVKLAMKQN